MYILLQCKPNISRYFVHRFIIFSIEVKRPVYTSLHDIGIHLGVILPVQVPS